MYDNSRMRREIGRYIQHLRDSNLTQGYVLQVEGLLGKFLEYCRGRGVRSVKGVSVDEVRDFMGQYNTMSAGYQRFTYTRLRGFLAHWQNPSVLTFKLRVRGWSRAFFIRRPPDEAAQLHAADHRLQDMPRVQEAHMRRGELLRGVLQGCQLRKVLMMAGEVLERCANLISPGLLNYCRLYHRKENRAPEKCWDKSTRSDLPASALLICPNNTAARTPITFTAEQLADAYPVFGKLKSHAKTPWDHEGGYDDRPFEHESDEEESG
jgi:hypothetical protein